jgi:hypothetical protein
MLNCRSLAALAAAVPNLQIIDASSRLREAGVDRIESSAIAPPGAGSQARQPGSTWRDFRPRLKGFKVRPLHGVA